MERRAVQSSDLRSVGYDPQGEVLEIEFHSGGVCQYLGVPEPIYAALIQAGSKGTYFHSHIKDRFRVRWAR